MALSVKDYKEIIALTKQIKDEEKELARLKRDGKELDKTKLENLKAQLEVRRKNNEEAESEYKSTEKAYKSASNLSKQIVGNSDDLLKRKKLISQYDKSSSDIQLQAADALRKSAEFEDTILKTKTKSNMLNFNSKEMIEEINEQLEVINSQYEDASDTQKVILANTMEDLDLTKEKVKTLGKQADKIKGQKAAHDKLNELAGGYIDKLESGILMIKEMGKEIAKNPTVAFTAMGVAVGQAIEYGIARTKDMQQDVGLAREQALQLRREFSDIKLLPDPFKKFFVGFDAFALLLGTDSGKSAAGLVQEFGNLANVTEENVNQVMLFEKGLMVGSETSAKLLQNFMKIRGESSETAMKSQEFLGALAIANGIPVQMLMKDVSDNTETFAEFSIQGTKNIEMAAAQARKLGLNLSTSAKIANSLLDFESSIEKEMSASLLVGKQLNYNRARQLALEGNIAGATQDIMSQLGGQAGFARLNVIQRRALAESIGVSVEELSRLASGKVELKSPDNESREALRKSIDKNTNMLDNMLGKSAKGLFGGLGALLSLLGSFLPELSVSYLFMRGFKDIGKIFKSKGIKGVFKDFKSAAMTGMDDLVKGAKRRLNLVSGTDDILDAGIKNPKNMPKGTILTGPPKGDASKIIYNEPFKPNPKNVPPPKTPPVSGGRFKMPASLQGMKGKGGLLAIGTEAFFLADELSDDTLSTRDKTKTIVDSATGLGGAAAGAALGATLGSVVPVVGTAIGGILGGIGGYFLGEKVGGAAFDYGAEVLDARMEEDETAAILSKSDTENTDRVVQSIDLLNLEMQNVKQEIQNLNPQRQ